MAQDEETADDTTDKHQQDGTDMEAAADNGFELVTTAALRRKAGEGDRKDRYVLTITQAAREAGIEDGDPLIVRGGVEDGDRMLMAGIPHDGNGDIDAYQDGSSIRIAVPTIALEDDLAIDLSEYDPDAPPKFRLHAGDETLLMDPIDESMSYLNDALDGEDAEQSRPMAVVHDLRFQGNVSSALVRVISGETVRDYQIEHIRPDDGEPVVKALADEPRTDLLAIAAIDAGLTALQERDPALEFPSWIGDVDYQFRYGHCLEGKYIVEAAHVSGVDPDELERVAFEAESQIIENAVLDGVTDRMEINSYQIVGVDNGWWRKTLRQRFDMDISDANLRAIERAHKAQAKALTGADQGALPDGEVVVLPARNDYQ